MCGIVGVIGSYDHIRFERMVDILSHRGPDARNIFRDENCILGHTRLKVIDTSDYANQPMVSACGNYIIVFNGEIYNYKDIRRSLDVKLYTNSDTEVLLYAYIKWDESCLGRLNGMFSFAIWDRKKQKLFAARDRFGIKPFYYYHDLERFIFASEIKAILKAGIARVPNYHAIYDFMRWGAIDHSERTWFKNVYSLPQGYCLSMKNGFVRIRRYWSLTDIVDEKENPAEEGIVEEFTYLLEDSIKLQMVADRRVGINLSGGVDSSVLTVLASRLRDDITTYTFGYDEHQYDERPFAKEVAGIVGVENYTSLLTAEDVERYFLRVLIAEDEPFTSFRQLSHHKLYSDYKTTGSTVVLEGSGGDEIGAGYIGFLWSWYLDLINEKGPEIGMMQFSHEADLLGMNLDDKLAFALGSAANYSQYGICTSDGIPFVNPDVLHERFVRDYATDFPNYEKPFKSNLRNAQFIEMFYTKLPRGLRYVERASSSAGREARVPLLDPRIVAIGFKAPNKSKILNGQFRKFMKESIRNILPNEITRVNKRTVADPQRDWIKGQIVYLFDDILNSRTFREREIFNVETTRVHFEKFKQKKKMNSLGVFQFFITEMWFRVYIDTDFYQQKPDDVNLSEFNKEFS